MRAVAIPPIPKTPKNHPIPRPKQTASVDLQPRYWNELGANRPHLWRRLQLKFHMERGPEALLQVLKEKEKYRYKDKDKDTWRAGQKLCSRFSSVFYSLTTRDNHPLSPGSPSEKASLARACHLGVQHSGGGSVAAVSSSCPDHRALLPSDQEDLLGLHCDIRLMTVADFANSAQNKLNKNKLF